MIAWFTRPFQIAALVAALIGAWELNNWTQRLTGRSEGRSEVTSIVEKKAEANATTGNEVREAVAAGQRGKPDPYRRDRVQQR